uniref:YqaJ viral recombinase domain-containing protein n=1 Tax=Oncorhynchus tshawytscha TaxID=74940 RepID=A0A8C8EZC9_ONCTS
MAELKFLTLKSTVLTRIVKDHSDVDTASGDSNTNTEDLPEPLTALYDANLRDLSPPEIKEKSEEAFQRLKQKLTRDQCESLELTSKEQSKCQAWHTNRIGRITSTAFHRVCTAGRNTDKINLVKKTMHYNDSELHHVPAVLWGRDMEDTARKYYTEEMSKIHANFSVKLSGLVVRNDQPHLGASPDGLVNCSCCGRGTLEVKCPYKYRDGLTGCSDDTQFCLDKSLHLKKNHEYYHQVQLHMFVCNVQYCDFVVWTSAEVIVRRIIRDEEMLRKALPKAERFFIASVRNNGGRCA